MGCCETKEEISPRYLYRQLNMHETSALVMQRAILCHFCHQYIINPYEPMTECTHCKTVLGHARCVSFYRMNHACCPHCKNT